MSSSGTSGGGRAAFGDDSDEEKKDLSDPETVTKYRMAGDIVNSALQHVRQATVPGALIAELCALGDKYITDECAKIYSSGKSRRKPRGIAFPTCVSVNNIVGHLSPLEGETLAVQAGDLVKIDLGVHVDGYPVTAAQSFVCGAGPAGEGVNPRQADVLAAAYYAGEAVLRLCKPGVKSIELPPVLEKVAASFGVNLCEGIVSHRMDRNEVTCEESILNRPAQGEHASTEFTFQPNQVFHIDVVVSTGEGKTRESEMRTTVFRRTGTVYELRLKASRALLADVNKNHPFFAFTLRSLPDPKSARLGVTECLTHELLDPFPVLTEREGEYVAQVKYTVLVMPSGPIRITEVLPLQLASEKQITDEGVKALLATSLAKKKKKNRKKKAAAAAASSAAAADDDDDEGDD